MQTNTQRFAAVALIGVLVAGAAGCQLATYAKHRVEDLLDVADIGITWSAEPCFALYYDLTPFVPIGVGYTDGYFAGLGFGALRLGDRFYQRSMGFIFWGEEEVGWGRFDRYDPATMNANQAGIVGILSGDVPGPDYFPSCLHYIHLGFVGVVANLRYLQAVDFALGWLTIDICFDDGVIGPARWSGKNIIGFSRDEVREFGPELMRGLPGGADSPAALAKVIPFGE